MAPGEDLAGALDGVPGVIGAVVAEQDWAVRGRGVSLEVDGVGGDREAEASFDVLDEPSLLPVGVRRGAQREQDVVRAECRDGVGDDGQDAATEGSAVGVHVDRVQVAEHGVEALVGDVPIAVDVVGEPGEPAGERGREHVDLGRRVEDRAHGEWQLVDVGDGGIGDEQEPLDRWSTVLRAGVWGCAMSVHRWLLAGGCSVGDSSTPSPSCASRARSLRRASCRVL